MARDQPVGTIVIPVHNGESGLTEAVDSALSAAGHSWAILISDNASTDNTRSLLQKYSHDSRVTVLFQQTMLPVLEHFNLALSHVATPLACLLGHDDRIEPGNLVRAVDLLEQNPDKRGVLPLVINEYGNGVQTPAYDQRELHRVEGLPRVPTLWYFKRRFPAVNAIYGIWQTQHLHSALRNCIEKTNLTNPMSDRALATMLLRCEGVVVARDARLVKGVRPTSMYRLSLTQEMEGFRQIADVLRNTLTQAANISPLRLNVCVSIAILVSAVALLRATLFQRHQPI
jgi:glycosyltransferase involved in cell wall biosynthesis